MYYPTNTLHVIRFVGHGEYFEVLFHDKYDLMLTMSVYQFHCVSPTMHGTMCSIWQFVFDIDFLYVVVSPCSFEKWHIFIPLNNSSGFVELSSIICTLYWDKAGAKTTSYLAFSPSYHEMIRTQISKNADPVVLLYVMYIVQINVICIRILFLLMYCLFRNWMFKKARLLATYDTLRLDHYVAVREIRAWFGLICVVSRQTQ